MAQSRFAVAPVPRTFDELGRQVTAVLVTGRTDIEHAWVRTYHEIGRLINAHLLAHRGRADYGGRSG